MKNIGILLDRQINITNIDSIKNGNPGIGGSEYLLLQLFYYLSQDNEYSCKLYTIGETINDASVISIISDMDAIEKATANKTDIFVFIPKDRKNDFYEKLQNFNLISIAWVHNYISYNVIKLLQTSQIVKRVIFVGKQHYDCYIDDELINKSDYIYNMLNNENHEYISPENKEQIVTYVGALIPTKGFHKLAKVWKNILKKVPTAKLQVIGDGKLYNKNAVLGPHGIAEAKYEKKIVKYLSDKNGMLLDSVKFFGSLGNEKKELIQKTKVGIANPTGKSETFCLSAVEYKTFGVPVVTYKGFGLLDTVRNNIDGILIKSGKELENAIVTLLTDNQKNSEYGKNGLTDGFKKFLPETIIEQWKNVFSQVCADIPPQVKKPKDYFFDDFKWLKIINYYLKHPLHTKLPSIAYSISRCKEFIKNILKRN
ncbi:MAG: glycosyltransferase [Spirochaetota bacterium]|nr:glycosyltransferase [Spirochaetota bacterium]